MRRFVIFSILFLSFLFASSLSKANSPVTYITSNAQSRSAVFEAFLRPT